MPKYEFFTSNGLPGPADKRVRSHAMKTALQLRSKTTSEGVPPGAGAAANSKRTATRKIELQGRFRLSDASTKRLSGSPREKSPTGTRHTALYTPDNAAYHSHAVSTPVINNSNHSNCRPGVEWLGVHLLDPFGTLPIQSNPRIDTLLKHLLVSFDYLTTTVPTHKTWLSIAMNDPLLIRVTLSMTAAFVAMKTPLFCLQLRKEGWRLRGETISSINAIIRTGGFTENLLSAIAHLGHVACLEGSVQEADMHLRGLQALVAFRGGITSIKAYQVGRFINWADLELATALGRRPLFHLHYNLDRVNLPQHMVETSQYPSLSRLEGLGPGHKVVTRVIQLLRQRVMAAKLNMDATQRDIRTLWFSAVFLILDHVESIPTASEEQCLHTLNLATLLFICASMGGDHHWSTSLPTVLAQRLRSSLQTGPLVSATWGNHLPELLWVLFVGAASDNGIGETQGHGSWFISPLGVVRQLLGCNTRSEFEGYLHCVVWDDSFGAEFLDDWWPDAPPI